MAQVLGYGFPRIFPRFLRILLRVLVLFVSDLGLFYNEMIGIYRNSESNSFLNIPDFRTLRINLIKY